MPADEWNRELSEFVRAAMVFKPMSKLMASRFTSSSSTILPASSSSSDTPLLTKPSEKPEDPAEAAAKIHMYGYLTRTTTEFYPTRLLCKRFNVKDPHPVPAGEEENKDVADTSLVNAEAVRELKREARGAVTGSYDLANVEVDVPVEIHADRNEVLEGERAGEEIFKSIFGDDSDED
jgi:G patch domain-containing protein 1